MNCPNCNRYSETKLYACRCGWRYDHEQTPEFRLRQRLGAKGTRGCRCRDIVALINRYGDRAMDHMPKLVRLARSKNSRLTATEAEEIIKEYIDGKRQAGISS